MSTRKSSTTPPRRRLTTTTIAVFVAVAAVIVAVVAVGGSAQSPAADDAVVRIDEGPQPEKEQSLDLARRIDGEATALGAVDAPVVLVEYADYRCPFCGVFARDTMPTLVAEYVEAGELRIEWRDLPVFGDESESAAVAGRAAGAQGKFWEYHEAIFAGAPERGHPSLPREKLIELAGEAGVADIEQFTRDLDDPELLATVLADREEGAQLGITSTPIFIVNNTPIAGAQPLDTFRQVIEAELEKAGR